MVSFGEKAKKKVGNLNSRLRVILLLLYQYVFAIGLVLHLCSATIQKFRLFLECLGGSLLTYIFTIRFSSAQGRN